MKASIAANIIAVVASTVPALGDPHRYRVFHSKASAKSSKAAGGGGGKSFKYLGLDVDDVDSYSMSVRSSYSYSASMSVASKAAKSTKSSKKSKLLSAEPQPEVQCVGMFPVCPGMPVSDYCDGAGDCFETDFCNCAVGQSFCESQMSPCVGFDPLRCLDLSNGAGVLLESEGCDCVVLLSDLGAISEEVAEAAEVVAELEVCCDGDDTAAFNACALEVFGGEEDRSPWPTMAWDPTPGPTAPCSGNTPGWTDSFGDGCAWYVENDTLGCPVFGNAYGGSSGVANDNCCWCFGTGVSLTTLNSFFVVYPGRSADFKHISTTAAGFSYAFAVSNNWCWLSCRGDG